MAWTFLAGAIIFELIGTFALRMAALGNKKWHIVTVAGYITTFGFLSLALTNGMGIGVAYGIWAAMGIALTAVISRILFKEPLTLIMSLGVALVAVGVILLEVGQH